MMLSTSFDTLDNRHHQFAKNLLYGSVVTWFAYHSCSIYKVKGY